MKFLLFASFMIVLFSCSKENAPPDPEIIPIPNGDFENWNNILSLDSWQTNSCPVCDPPYETYIIRKDSSSYHGSFAAKFIYNDVFPAQAKNDFYISTHPTNLTGYVKSKFPSADSASIRVYLFNNGVMVDSGKTFITTSMPNWTKFEIPISANSVNSDSASIILLGGTHSGAELWIDYLRLIKN